MSFVSLTSCFSNTSKSFDSKEVKQDLGRRMESYSSWSVCLVCKQDSDHPHLLLCEKCNDPYHTYCLGLKSIPDDDFICGKKIRFVVSVDNA